MRSLRSVRGEGAPWAGRGGGRADCASTRFPPFSRLTSPPPPTRVSRRAPQVQLAEANARPTQAQLSAYAALSAQFVEIEAERSVLLVSEAQARRDLALAKEELAALRERSRAELDKAEAAASAATSEANDLRGKVRRRARDARARRG